MGFIFGIIAGFIIGYFYSQSKITVEQPKPRAKRIQTYQERQKAKVMYISDADRIRELNQLSPNETKFMRILQREFIDREVVAKNKRFYIADKDNYPIAIFEYRDGLKALKNEDVEDGLPLFLYKGILSSDEISNDRQKL